MNFAVFNQSSIFAASTSTTATDAPAPTLWVVMGIAVVVFLIVMLAMAIGVMMGRRPISGSCGGLGNQLDENGQSRCSLCENPSEACRQLRQQQESPKDPAAS